MCDCQKKTKTKASLLQPNSSEKLLGKQSDGLAHYQVNTIPGEFYDFHEACSAYYGDRFDSFRDYVVTNWERFNDGKVLKLRKGKSVNRVLNSRELTGVLISAWGIDCLFTLFDRQNETK